jgi:ABC-type Fe3+-siderophore transport system permease subunit
VRLFLATGDPRVGQVVTWLGGSTYGVELPLAASAAAVAAIGVALSLRLSRTLEVLAVGDATARGVGIDVPRARMLVLSMAAVLVAPASIVIGPMSFAGLLAPRFAAMIGFRRPRAHLLRSASIGGLLIIVSD